MVDLLHNFYITWGKRQDDLDLKLDKLFKEYKRLEEQFSLINNNINLVLKVLEDSKTKQNIISQNSDYIKEDTSLIYKRIDSLLNLDKLSVKKEKVSEVFNSEPELIKIKKLVEEVKTLVLS